MFWQMMNREGKLVEWWHCRMGRVLWRRMMLMLTSFYDCTVFWPSEMRKWVKLFILKESKYSWLLKVIICLSFNLDKLWHDLIKIVTNIIMIDGNKHLTWYAFLLSIQKQINSCKWYKWKWGNMLQILLFERCH